jgi:hypothetical protein
MNRLTDLSIWEEAVKLAITTGGFWPAYTFICAVDDADGRGPRRSYRSFKNMLRDYAKQFGTPLNFKKG